MLADFRLPVITGGGTGIMEGVSRGVADKGGITVGILPQGIEHANPYISIPISTGMGIGRNIIIVRSSDVIIAIDGSYGTLSELAYSAQLNKKVICYKSSFSNVIPCIEAESIEHIKQLISDLL